MENYVQSVFGKGAANAFSSMPVWRWWGANFRAKRPAVTLTAAWLCVCGCDVYNMCKKCVLLQALPFCTTVRE